MGVQLDPRQQTSSIASCAPPSPSTISQPDVSGGLANVGSSLQANGHVGTAGWIHWIKEKVVQLVRSLLSCFYRASPNPAPVQPNVIAPQNAADQTPLNQPQVNTIPISSQGAAQTTISGPSRQEIAQANLNQRIAQGNEILNNHFEILDGLENNILDGWRLEGKVLCAMRYNGRVALALDSVCEGREDVQSRAMEKLHQLLSAPENGLCENGTLAIDSFIFTRSAERHLLRNLQRVNYSQVSSTVTFNNRAGGYEIGPTVMTERGKRETNVEEGTLLNTFRSILSNPENATDLINQIRAHVFTSSTVYR